jgi:hypothetical protein
VSDTPEFPELPPHLRLLKTLVTILTAVMIVGVIVVVGVIVTRFPVAVRAPEALQMPEGVGVSAVTHGRGWWVVVTQDDRILVFGLDGALRQEITLRPEL